MWGSDSNSVQRASQPVITASSPAQTDRPPCLRREEKGTPLDPSTREWEEPPHDLPPGHGGPPVLPRCCHRCGRGPGLPGPLHTGPGSRGPSVREAPSRVGLSRPDGQAERRPGFHLAVSHLEVHRKLEEGQRRGNCFAGVTSALLTPAESGGWSQASPLSPTCCPLTGSLTTHSTTRPSPGPVCPSLRQVRPKGHKGQGVRTQPLLTLRVSTIFIRAVADQVRP